MDKPFKENPFLHSDIDKGGAPLTYKADETVIPVRTWAHGSPFNAGGASSLRRSGVSKASGESSGEYGDLDKYWPQLGEGEGEVGGEGEGEETTAPNAQSTSGIDEEKLKFGSWGDEKDDAVNDDAEEDIASPQSDRPEQASVNYDTTDLPEAFLQQFNSVLAKYDGEQAAKFAGTAAAEAEEEEDGDGAEEEEEDYGDDYEEESDEAPLSYEESERVHSQSSARDHLAGIGDLAAYMGMGDTEGENVFFAEGGRDDDDNGDPNVSGIDDGFLPHSKDWARHPRRQQQPKNHGADAADVTEIVSEYQRIYAALQSPEVGERRGGGGGGRSDKVDKAERDQLRLLKKSRKEKEKNRELREKEPATGGDVEHRHRKYLADVASKRRTDYEMLLTMAIKAEARRKKFKEALLEKALKARAVAEAAAEAAATAALAAGGGNGKKGSKEAAKRDEGEEKALRKKFVAQHKKMLADLVSRNKEEEARREEEKEVEKERRARARRRSLKMIDDRDRAEGAESDGAGVDAPEADLGGPEDGQTDVGVFYVTEGDEIPASEEDRLTSALATALGVGSALSAVRGMHSRRPAGEERDQAEREDGVLAASLEGGLAKPKKRKEKGEVKSDKTKKITVVPDAAVLIQQEEDEREEKLAQRLRQEMQKAKVAAYLAVLAETKKKEETERRRQQERARKRALILSARIMAEAQERKLMGAEDKPRHRAIAAEKEKEKSAGTSRQTTSHKEPAPKKPAPSASAPSTTAPDEEGEKAESKGVTGVRNEDKTFKLPPKVVGGGSITAEAAEALFQRLKAKQAKTAEGVEAMAASSVPARDFNDWKRKNAVPADGLVFAMTGWYPCVKQALLDRGWYFNADTASPFFDLKWTLRSMECDQDLLQPWQLTNHFMKNVAITTKVGLIKSLQSLVWLADVEANDVIPRGYDLSLPNEMQAFIDDFRCQRAEGVLKSVYQKATGVAFPPVDIRAGTVEPSTAAGENSDEEDDDEDEEEEEDEESSDSEGNDENDDEADDAGTEADDAPSDAVEEASPTRASSTKPNKWQQKEARRQARAAVAAAKKVERAAKSAAKAQAKLAAEQQKREKLRQQQQEMQLKQQESEIDAEYAPPPTPRAGPGILVNSAVLKAAIEVMEACIHPLEDDHLDAPIHGDADSPTISALQWELLNFDIYSKATLPVEPDAPVDGFLERSDNGDDNIKFSGNTRNASSNKKGKDLSRQAQRERDTAAVECTTLVALTDADVRRIHHLLCSTSRLYRQQARLNGQGECARNIWIVKPAAKSRGRGITTFSDLPKLLKYVDAGTGGSQASQWIVQKYMENPLTIAQHKFDLRQWVLVTDWNPLTVYFYDECYARFSVEEYSTKESDLDNAYVHLVNNSVSKNSELFNKVVTAENGCPIEGYMWSHDQFAQYVHSQTGQDLMATKIKPRMKDIARWSLMCASECIEHRKNSWELYGFDFMVDDSYNAWLIEINSSPACDYSTKTTETYVKKALVELLSVTLDVRQWEASNRKTRGDKPDTGGWELIHKGPLLEMPAAAFGTDISIKGEGVKRKVQPQSTYTGSLYSAPERTSDKGADSSKTSTSVRGRTAPLASSAASSSSSANRLTPQPPAPKPRTNNANPAAAATTTAAVRPGRTMESDKSQERAAEKPRAAFPSAGPQALGPRVYGGGLGEQGSISDSLDGDSVCSLEGLPGAAPFMVKALVPTLSHTAALLASQIASETKENTHTQYVLPPPGPNVMALGSIGAGGVPPLSHSTSGKAVPVPPVGRSSAPIKAKVFEIPF